MERKVLSSRKVGKSPGKVIHLQDKNLSFVVLKNPDQNAVEPLIYLLSSLKVTPSRVASRYPIRWQIETCFKHLKSNGFNLEEMNHKGEERSRLIMATVVFAYTLSVCEGLKEYKKVPINKYKSGLQRKAYSVFRIGLDRISAFCYKLEAFLVFSPKI